MYGEAGQWFKPFALTIACSVLVSLFVSFSLDPMLSAYWPDPQVEDHEHAQRGPISRVLARFNQWFDRQADRYKTVIAWALDHRLAVTSLAGGTFVLAHRAAGDDRRHGLRARERPERDQSHHRGAGREQSRIHAAAHGGDRGAGAQASGGRVHVHVDRWCDSVPRARRGSGARVRATRAKGEANYQPGRARSGVPSRIRAREWRERVRIHERLRRRGEGSAGRDARARSGRAAAARGAGNRERGEGAGRGGRRTLDAWREARARRAAQSRARRFARHHRGRGRAVASAGVRRAQGWRLDRIRAARRAT